MRKRILILAAAGVFGVMFAAVHVATTQAACSNDMSHCSAGDTQAPTASITAPSNNTAIAIGSVVTVQADASDNIGVTKVVFYIDGSMVSVSADSPYTYKWGTTSASPGVHTLAVKAYDAAGNSTMSVITNITLTGSQLAPLAGDINGDQRVNGLDYSILIAHKGQSYPAADLNHDGIVGPADVEILLSHWTW